MCWWFRADDLIPEESETVLLALKRLDQKESYDRVYRLRRAFQVCIQLQSKPMLFSMSLTIRSYRSPTNSSPRNNTQSPKRSATPSLGESNHN